MKVLLALVSAAACMPAAAGLLGAAIAAVCLASPATAGPAVTVYARDYAFVRETRAFDVTGRADTLRLVDLPTRLDPTSVRFVPAQGSVARLAYRGDLVSGEQAIDRARGSQVRIAARDGRMVEGELLSADGTWLLVRAADGTVQTVARTVVEEVRMSGNPAAGVLRPTLEVALAGARAGKLNAELSYLTAGLSWGAEHVVVRGGAERAEWSSRVSVQNHSGADFVDASLKLVAGDPRRTSVMPVPVARASGMMMETAGKAAADLTEEAFSEYHLYTLSRPATLRDGEVQQLTMLEPRGVKVTPRYVYRGGGREVLAQLELSNSKSSGLGEPLPGGRVRVYEPDASGALQFTGEAGIRHTPVDEKFTLDVGAAFDLVAERTVLFERRLTDRERETGVEIKLRNRKKDAVTIIVEEILPGDWEIRESTHPFTRKDARTARAETPVAAGKEVVVRYTARSRF